MRSLLALLIVLLTASSARASDLEWDPRWPRFRVAEHIATGTMAATALTLYLLPEKSPAWGGGILFDDAVRDLMRGRTLDSRRLASRISDVAYLSLLIEPIAISGPVVPTLRDSFDVGAQITLINLEAFALTAVLFRVTEVTTRRARPYQWDCMKHGRTDAECHQSIVGRTTSFMGGHAGLAATGAALTCVHQLQLHIYGTVGAPIACGTAIALAVTAGVGRIVADKHYATDVIVGWIVGAASGILVPVLLHYGEDGRGVGDTGASSSAPLVASFATSF
jgi:membrane-associated phospholipid phosphatase